MRKCPALMTMLLSLALLMLQGQGHAAAQDHQGGAAREAQSGPRVDHALVARTLGAHREDFKRQTFDPVTPSLQRGDRLPDNVTSEQLPDTVKQALPRYEGYAWRRIGNDIVLIGIASDTFYEIFPAILADPDAP